MLTTVLSCYTCVDCCRTTSSCRDIDDRRSSWSIFENLEHANIKHLTKALKMSRYVPLVLLLYSNFFFKEISHANIIVHRSMYFTGFKGLFTIPFAYQYVIYGSRLGTLQYIRTNIEFSYCTESMVYYCRYCIYCHELYSHGIIVHIYIHIFNQLIY